MAWKLLRGYIMCQDGVLVGGFFLGGGEGLFALQHGTGRCVTSGDREGHLVAGRT